MGRSLKGIKKRPKQSGPQTERDRLFCERWLIHFDRNRAYREAGFTGNVRTDHAANKKLERFAEYLRPIKEAKARIMAERLAVTSEQIVDAMVKKAFFDPSAFFERSDAQLTTQDGKPRTWDGKPVYGERMKPYSDLTPEQQSIVEITGEADGQIHYRLPSIREQHTHLTSIGRQFGLFLEKVIEERHLHRHVHHQLDFSGVPSTKLLSLTRQMLPLVGQEFALQLGYTPEEVEAAAREEVNA